MNVDVAEIRRQEEETSDLPLSVLYQWQKVLDVPIAELLVESEDSLSQPLLQRAQLVRLMKTALALLEQADNEATRAMAQTLVDQLVEVMPELQGISAWHAVGRRRTPGRVGHRRHANAVRGRLRRSRSIECKTWRPDRTFIFVDSRILRSLLERHRWLVFVLPMAVYMLVGSIEPSPGEPGGKMLGLAIPYAAYPLVYTVKIALTLAAMALVLPGYRQFRRPPGLLAVLVGAVGIVVWVGLWHLSNRLGLTQLLAHLLGYGQRPAFNPLEELAGLTPGLGVDLPGDPLLRPGRGRAGDRGVLSPRLSHAPGGGPGLVEGAFRQGQRGWPWP